MSSNNRPRPVVGRHPLPIVRPAVDPRTFVARMKRRIAAGSVVTFGAFFGLATLNVVGVSALATRPGATTPVSSAAPVLAPGDFFGLPQGPSVAGPLPEPQVILGGGPPMLTSGGS